MNLKKLASILILFPASSLLVSFSCLQPPGISQGYQVKAVFLFNFAQFVEWPAEAFSEKQAPLIIGVLGKDPFGVLLDETVSGEKSNGHPLVVTRYEKIEDVTHCHILFINLPTEKKQLAMLSSLKGRSILTVGDADGFTRDGGMVGFTMENNKIHLKINLNAVKADNLTISSKLLRLAQIVDSKNN